MKLVATNENRKNLPDGLKKLYDTEDVFVFGDKDIQSIKINESVNVFIAGQIIAMKGNSSDELLIPTESRLKEIIIKNDTMIT